MQIELQYGLPNIEKIKDLPLAINTKKERLRYNVVNGEKKEINVEKDFVK